VTVINAELTNYDKLERSISK